jgi:hypothetical protein
MKPSLPRDREAEVRVELVSDAEGICLDSYAKELTVAVVGEHGLRDLQPGNFGERQRDSAEPFDP